MKKIIAISIILACFAFAQKGQAHSSKKPYWPSTWSAGLFSRMVYDTICFDDTGTTASGRSLGVSVYDPLIFNMFTAGGDDTLFLKTNGQRGKTVATRLWIKLAAGDSIRLRGQKVDSIWAYVQTDGDVHPLLIQGWIR